MAIWYPEFVTNLFTVCVPYFPPTSKYIDIETVAKYKFPSLSYQIVFASGEVEKHIKSKEEIRSFLNALYGGRTPAGEVGFTSKDGPLYDKLPSLEKSPLVSDDEIDFYTEEFSRHGIHGPLNYYRTRKLNFDDEQVLLKGDEKTPPVISCPYLFVLATNDIALRPEMAAGQERVAPQLTVREVESNHWALWEKPAEVNEILREWFTQHGIGKKEGVKL